MCLNICTLSPLNPHNPGNIFIQNVALMHCGTDSRRLHKPAGSVPAKYLR